MILQETLLITFNAAKPLLPFMAAAGLLTCVALAVLLVMSRGLWFDKPAFRWLGLFYGLSKGGCLRLGCAWLKLCILLSYLAAFQKLTAAHYVLFLVPALIFSVPIHRLTELPANLLGVFMELVGLVAANVVCGYIRDLHPGAGFLLVYILVSVFLALYAIYLFLTELNAISNGRRIQIED